MKNVFTRRSLRAGMGIAAIATIPSCNDFLAVENPGSLDVSALTDSAYASLLVNGVIGEFQEMFGTVTMYSSVLADESGSSHVNASFGPVDLRNFNNQLDINLLVYRPLARSRYVADSTADRLRGYRGPDAGKDLRLARVLAYSGYTYTLLAELFCEAPIQRSAAFTPNQLFAQSLPKYDSAIAVARTAKTAGANATVADSLINLALVGAARASLGMGDKAKAISYAQQVGPNFRFEVYYLESNTPADFGLSNPLFVATGFPSASTVTGTGSTAGWAYSSGSLWMVVGEGFQSFANNLDPRVPMTPTRVRAMNATNQFVANQPTSYSGYQPPTLSGTTVVKAGNAIQRGSLIRLASTLEAEYIIAEAQGGTAATLAFVNGRRAAGNQDEVAGLGALEIMAELRDQRKRDFYLDLHRLGDLRRYKSQYQIDQFPTGPAYGTVECWLIPIAEINDNPNLQPPKP